MTDNPLKPPHELVAALDEAATTLLSKIVRSDNVKIAAHEDGTPADDQQADVSEQVKIFQAIVRYLEVRSGHAPKGDDDRPQEPSKFDSLRSQFNGETPRRRRNTGGSKAAARPANGRQPGGDDDGDPAAEELLN